MRDGDYSLVADPDYALSTDNMFREAWIPTIRAGGYTNWRLYHLRRDPGQTTDISSIEPDRLERMKAELMRINNSIMTEGADWHISE